MCLVSVAVLSQGISLGYHRLLTHRSLKVPVWLERLYVLMAICCLQETPAKWVSTHRVHHQHSDDEPDPHTPLVSLFWSHVGWLIFTTPQERGMKIHYKAAKDILKDPFYNALERKEIYQLYIILGHIAIFMAAGAVAGYLFEGTAAGAFNMCMGFLAWGVFMRMVICWHCTWSVNSLTHFAGYRNYETRENSRNNWLVAALTAGEGWHNNHHAEPRAASLQTRWWELDPTYWHIWVLKKVGLAKDVVPRKLNKAESEPASEHTDATMISETPVQ